MALADYAAPIADDENPLLGCVRVRDGVIETATPGHAQRRGAGARSLAISQRAIRLHGAAGRRTRPCVALARDAVRLTGLRRLALAGGVVSNVKATRRIRSLPERGRSVRVPAHGRWRACAGGRRSRAPQDHGIACGLVWQASTSVPSTIRRQIAGEPARRRALPRIRVDDLARRVAGLLEDGRIVMWFQGRMEYGPRALGHRSVLARPDRPELRDRLNLVLKRRVWYQPFCPSMLESEAARVACRLDGRPQPAHDDGVRGARVPSGESGRRDQRGRHVPPAARARYGCDGVRRPVAPGPRAVGNRARS